MRALVKKLFSCLLILCLAPTLLPATTVPAEAASEVWDGSSQSYTAPVGGVYYLSNGAELAWAIDAVNNHE